VPSTRPAPRHALGLLAPVVAAAIVLGGCSAAAFQAADHAYLSVGVTEGGAAKRLVPGTRIRLDFGGTNLTASAGCNSMSGAYRVDGGRLRFENTATTAMGCDAERHAQDEWLSTFLASGPVVTLAGSDLTLEAQAVVVRLVDREVAEPDRNLVGPTWTVESIIDGSTASSVPQGLTATLELRPDGTFTVDAGCNRGGGSWKLQGAGVEFADVILTKMACDRPRGELEAAVMRVVGGGVLAAEVDSNVLTLRSGASGLQLRTSRGG
jgi:heat shock protein HslJ